MRWIWMLSALSVTFLLGCNMQPSQPTSFRRDKYVYGNMQFSGSPGNESDPEYIYGVTITPSKGGLGPLLYVDDVVINISRETRTSIVERFPHEAFGGTGTISIKDNITIACDGDAIRDAFAKEAGVALSEDSTPLKLPCSREEMIRHFGQPVRVVKQ